MITISTLFIKPTFAEAPEAPKRNLADYSIQELTEYFANYYGANYRDLYSTMMCESGGKSKPGDNGHANGVMQIHKPTFERWEKQMGEDLNYDSTFDQIKVSAWAFAQGESYRDDWTMYVALKNGGTYSFYSKLLQRHFTVHCNYVI